MLNAPLQSKPETFLRLLLRPIIRLCLKRALTFQEFCKLARVEFVRAAADELSGKNSASKLSVMTGIRRPDVMKILAEEENSEDPGQVRVGNIITKVIGAWLYDRRFSLSPGRPKTLTVSGKSSEFASLVRRVTSDISHHTVLFELERLGAITRAENSVTLTGRANVDRERLGDGYLMLAEDTADLVEAVDNNLRNSADMPNLHARTTFDNIDRADVPGIKEWLLEKGRKAHDEARAFLAEKDRDLNPSKRAPTERVRISFVTFSNVQNADEKADKSRRKR